MIEFKNLTFEIEDGKIFLSRIGNLSGLHSRIAEVQLAGENKITDMGVKMVNSSEGPHLVYDVHAVEGDTLCIIQRSTLVKVETLFTTYPDTNALRVQTVVRNISTAPLVLEEVSAFAFTGFPFDSDFTRLFRDTIRNVSLFAAT